MLSSVPKLWAVFDIRSADGVVDGLELILDEDDCARLHGLSFRPAISTERGTMVGTVELDARGLGGFPVRDGERHERGYDVGVTESLCVSTQCRLQVRSGQKFVLVELTSDNAAHEDLVEGWTTAMHASGAELCLLQTDAHICMLYEFLTDGGCEVPAGRTLSFKDPPHDVVVDYFAALVLSWVEP